jgi:hypothetical protein
MKLQNAVLQQIHILITIPNSVASIGEFVFYGCISLTDVTVGWTTPFSIEDGTFDYDSERLASCTLHVPADTKALYQAADVWKDFGTITEYK